MKICRTRLLLVLLVTCASSAKSQQYTIPLAGGIPLPDGRGQEVHVVDKRYPGELGESFPVGEPSFHSWGSISTRPRIAPSLVNSPSDDCNTSPKTTHPVIIATGEKIQSEPEFFDASLIGFSMERTYRSIPSTRPARLFGPRWYSSFDYPQMEFSSTCNVYPFRQGSGCLPDWINIGQPDGKTYQYGYTVWPMYYPPGFDGNVNSTAGYIVVGNSTNYAVTIKNRTYNYDPYSKNLVSIDEDGLRLYTFTYTPVDNRPSLTLVTARNGKTLRFNWGAGRVTSIVDSAGAVWSYEYDTNGNLTKVTPPVGVIGGVRQYHYESPVDKGLLTGITVDNVRKTSYSYDASGRVKRSGYENGEEFEEFTYSSAPLFTAVTDQRGQTTRYNFEQKGKFKRLTGVDRNASSTCGSSVANQAYDASGFITQSTDWNGHTTLSTFYNGGLPQSETTAAYTESAHTRKSTWSGSDIDTVILADSYGHDYLHIKYEWGSGLARSFPKAEIRTDLATNEVRRIDYAYTFHSNGVLESSTISQPLPDSTATTTYAYNSDGYLTSVTNPLGHVETFSQHNSRGQPGSRVDANGVTTIFSYDNEGKLLTSSEGVRLTKFSYNGDRQLTRIDLPDGRTTIYKYNTAGRTIEVGNALGEFVSMPLTAADIANNLSSATSERKIPALSGAVVTGVTNGAFTTTVQSDSLGRPYAELGNHGQRVDKRYDGNGNLISVSDALGRSTTIEYDAQNRRKRIVAADTGVTRMEYDSQGRLKALVDPRGLRTTYSYNAFGDVTGISSPDTGTTGYEYDTAGRLVASTAANGRLIRNMWDKLGRRLSSCSGSVCKSFTYDEGMYGKGLLTRFNDGTGQTSYTYNAFGELIGQRNDIYGQVFNTSWSYDSVGRMTGMTYPTGLMLIYEYDNVGRRIAIKSATALKTKN